MTAPRESVLRKVREWAEYAEDDLRLAEQSLSMSNPPYRLIAFHAQQCAEKYLKGLLVWHGLEVPRTHSISVLLELCEPVASRAAALRDAELLTDYAVSARYPGIEESVSAEEALEAVALARRVREAVRVELATDGGGPG